MNIHQVEFSAQGSEMTLLCKRRKGVSQLSWKNKNENIKSEKSGQLVVVLNLKVSEHSLNNKSDLYVWRETDCDQDVKCFTCSFVVDQFSHFALHHSQCFPRRLLHQQPQLPQVGKCEQVVDSITLMRSSRENDRHDTSSPELWSRWKG